MRNDLKTGFRSWEFWVSILCVVLTAFASIKSNEVYGMILDGRVGIYDGLYYSYVYGNFILNAVFPLFPIFACRKILIKKNYKNDAKRACTLSLLSCMIFILAFFVTYLYFRFFATAPSQVIAITGTFSPFCGNSVSRLFLYFFLNTLIVSISYILLGWAISYGSKHESVDFMLIPLIVYHIVMFIPFEIPNEFLANALTFIQYNVGTITKPLSAHIVSILVVYMLFIGIYMYKKRKIKKEINLR